MAIRRFMRFLAGEGVVSGDLAGVLVGVKEPNRLPRNILTDEEVRKILGQPVLRTPLGYRDRAILEILYSTGIRNQELRNLRAEDVDWEGGYVRVECGKGGKDRVVPLGRLAAEYGRRYLRVMRPMLLGARPDPGRLFLSQSGGVLDGSSLLAMVQRYARAAGIEKPVGCHSFRRACATEMIRNGANPYHVKELLGHEDVGTLRKYVRLTIVDLKEAHRKYHPREQEGASE